MLLTGSAAVEAGLYVNFPGGVAAGRHRTQNSRPNSLTTMTTADATTAWWPPWKIATIEMMIRPIGLSDAVRSRATLVSKRNVGSDSVIGWHKRPVGQRSVDPVLRHLGLLWTHSACLTLHMKRLQRSVNFKKFPLLFDLIGTVGPTARPYVCFVQRCFLRRTSEAYGFRRSAGDLDDQCSRSAGIRFRTAIARA